MEITINENPKEWTDRHSTGEFIFYKGRLYTLTGWERLEENTYRLYLTTYSTDTSRPTAAT